MSAWGAVDWTHQKFFEQPLARFWDRLREMVGCDEEEDIIVSVAELMAMTIMAARAGDEWQHKLVLYCGDNTNTIAWLSGTSPKNPYARLENNPYSDIF